MRKLIICSECGEEKLHAAKGLCKKCYDIEYRKKNSENKRINDSNYYINVRREREGILPMSKNKSCPLYLGVTVAEELLKNTFTIVEKMSLHNKGYDFICNRRMKIDAKSGVLRDRGIRGKSWVFGIRRNKIANYFACIGFDNRIDLNIIYFWLIPSNIVNDKDSLTISKNKLDKWEKYLKPIDKMTACCNVMKKGDYNERD